MPTAWSGAKTNIISISTPVSAESSQSLRSLRRWRKSLTGSNIIVSSSSCDTNVPGAASDVRNVGSGSWLRDNALTRAGNVHDPVGVVRHGRSEQFFPVGRSGAASESWRGTPGMVWLGIGTQWGLHTHALIAASNALLPTIFMTRVRL